MCVCVRACVCVFRHVGKDIIIMGPTNSVVLTKHTTCESYQKIQDEINVSF